MTDQWDTYSETGTMSQDGPFASPLSVVHTPGQQIGRYTIRGLLGVGGFGIVYQAEQVEPIRRMVALKILKPGMDSEAVLSRFDAERQALARMDHPCIAKIFDGGMTPEGRPYFVMELIQGRPVTDYCDGERMTLHDRIGLMIRVCDAVHHAHSKGVIHRDIKPSNVLVTIGEGGKPLPKVIDFGIAKALGSKLGEQTLVTQIGQMMGTPEYMSPEQADLTADDIDTRSDVYALGVMLYELLAGERPFQLRKLGFTDMQRIIREVDAPKPSTRLLALGDTADAVAENRSTLARSLVSSLRHELEWIPLKALRKDREQRYSSAAELGDDLRRYLAGEPLLAGPESTSYYLSKLAKRHRVPLTVAAGLGIVLVASTAISTHYYFRARSEQRITEAVNQYLNDDILQSLATGDVNTSLRMIDVLEAADRSATSRFGEQAEVEAAVRRQLARAFSRLGDMDRMIQQIERIDTLSGFVAGYQSKDIELESMRAEASYRHGRAEERIESVRTLLSDTEKRLGRLAPETTELLNQLAGLMKESKQLDEAEQLYQEALLRRVESEGEMSATALTCRHNLALIALERALTAGRSGSFELQEAYLRDATEQMESVVGDMRIALGESHMVTIGSMAELSGLWHRLSDYPRARAGYEAVLPLMELTLGVRHWRTIDIRANLGNLLARIDEPEAALEHLAEAFNGLMERRGPQHPSTQGVAIRLATVQFNLGLAAAATRSLDRVVNALHDPGNSGQPNPEFVERCRALLEANGVASPATWRMGNTDPG